MSTGVIFPARPEDILKDLGKLWTSLGHEEKEQGKPTVLRACAMTLVVATDEPDGGFDAAQIISELMHEHPSRGIVVAISNKGEHDIEARVLAQCWKPFGKAQQICCEQIEITTKPESWPNVGPTLIGLIAADLPVIFWCRHGAALSPEATRHQIAGIEAVMKLATKTIVDTRGADIATALDIISDWRTRGRLVGDLEWTRLTPWRQPLAQVFENKSRHNQLPAFHTVEVAYGNDRPPACALYAAAWLSAPFNARMSLVQKQGFGPGIHCISLRADDETIEFERTDPECMTLRSTNGRERKYNYTELSLQTLMNEELAVTGADSAFDSAFTRVRELAHGL
jgi:glucose-6-phosphate dehydrogenase assembly protein OpcA